MKTRKLGSLEVSEAGLGCMGMHHAYGAPRDEKEMEKLIHKAVDLENFRITFIIFVFLGGNDFPQSPSTPCYGRCP